MIDLRLGDWRKTLADIESVDAVITDPPYSQRTEDGFRSTTKDGPASPGLGYEPINEAYCREFVAAWLSRNRGWWVIFGDHISNRWWLSALADAGLMTFAPVIVVKHGAAPRMSGDGPASQCEQIAVARPRKKAFLSWGSLPGWYAMDAVRGSAAQGHHGVTGAKQLELMQTLVRDYSRRGELVCDPHVGGGTTLVAAAAEHRRAIGAEINPKTHAIASKRIARGFTPSFAFAEGA